MLVKLRLPRMTDALVVTVCCWEFAGCTLITVSSPEARLFIKKVKEVLSRRFSQKYPHYKQLLDKPFVLVTIHKYEALISRIGLLFATSMIGVFVFYAAAVIRLLHLLFMLEPEVGQYFFMNALQVYSRQTIAMHRRLTTISIIQARMGKWLEYSVGTCTRVSRTLDIRRRDRVSLRLQGLPALHLVPHDANPSLKLQLSPPSQCDARLSTLCHCSVSSCHSMAWFSPN